MAKKPPFEADLTALKEKIRIRVAETETPASDPRLRSLRKRLKRVQRKRRSLAGRKRHAMGKAGAAGKTDA